MHPSVVMYNMSRVNYV